MEPTWRCFRNLSSKPTLFVCAEKRKSRGPIALAWLFPPHSTVIGLLTSFRRAPSSSPAKASSAILLARSSLSVSALGGTQGILQEADMS